jgi:electron transfer flavoprotein beta subunit
MPKILVCYKWVLDEQDIKINPSDLSLDSTRAKGKISDYDRNAIEEAALLVEKLGGTADALTYGAPAVTRSIKDALSRGLNRVFWIEDASAEKADAFVTANVLAAAIRKIGPYDLILCGEASSDSYNQQIAPRIAALLDLPAITYVQEIGASGTDFSATRKLTDCTEVATVQGPVVISVMGEINKPRVPGLKQVLAAAKKPSEEIHIADLGLTPEALTPKVVFISVKGFVMSRKNVVYKDSDAAANVAKLVASFKQEGLC